MPENNTARRTRPWLYLIVAAAFVALDQLTKWLCILHLKAVGSVTLIPGLLRLTYLENRGAAFGSLTSHRWVFMVLSTVAIAAMIVYLLRYAEPSRLLRWTLALIIGGGVGNMIDRVVLGYVVDMIDFYGIWPYIFNVADSCVCVGAGMMVLYFILTARAEYKVKQDGGKS
jgi:signal peptidase II